MSRIVVTTLGTLGDLHPMIAIALELRQRGHDIVFVTDFLSRFYTAFARYACEPSHLAFFRRPRSGAIPLTNIEQHLLNQDLIYVGGGNTRAMLAIWREWHVDKILRKAWQSDVLLSGMSAGSIC